MSFLSGPIESLTSGIGSDLGNIITGTGGTLGPNTPQGTGPAGQPKTSPGKYTIAQLEEIWVQAGGSVASAPMAAAIAMAESSGISTATNHNTNGSTDKGLWQINTVHGSLSTYDPLSNASAAVQISKNGTDWGAWSTFTSPKAPYKAFLPAAEAALKGLQSEFSNPLSPTAIGSGSQAAAGAATGAISNVGDVLSAIWGFLTTPAKWVVVLKFVGGAVLVFLALKSLAGINMPSTVPVPV